MSRLDPAHRSRRGFTVNDISPVVVVIVLLLVGAVITFCNRPTPGPYTPDKVGKTQSLIQALKAGLDGFAAPTGPGAGTYPPATLETFGLPHDTHNTGIETLLMCLRTRKGGGPFINVKDWSDLIRDDDDTAVDAADAYQYFAIDATPATYSEIVDPWGNPLVYVPADRYDADFLIRDAYDEIVTIRASNIKTTDGKLPEHYVIWSFGPDGMNNYGSGDDITSWSK